MKKLTLTIVLMISIISTIIAQNTDFIDVKKGKDLSEIRIHEVNEIHIVYEQYGSLHDILKSNINYLIKDSISYAISDDGKLISRNIKVTKYLLGNEIKLKDEEDSYTVIKEEYEVDKSIDKVIETQPLEIATDTVLIEDENKDNNIENITNEILKLKDLYDEGIIDKEEFLLMKNKLYENKNTPKYEEAIKKEQLTEVAEEKNEKELSDGDLFELGYQDAIKHYKGNDAAAVGFVSGFVPVAGLISTIIISAVPTSNKGNMSNPNIALFNNTHYKKGYKVSASRIKRRKVWTGFLGGTATLIFLVSIF